MELDSWHYCYIASKGDLNSEAYEKYRNNGILNRITNHPMRIMFFAKFPNWCVDIVYTLRSLFVNLPKKILKKLLAKVRLEINHNSMEK